MLIFSKAIALIRHQEQDRSRWLLRWNASRQLAEFVEAPRLEGESSRDALFREIDWQLGLDRKADYLLSSVPRLHLELSPCGRVHPPKTFDVGSADFGIVELFTVEVYRAAVLERLAQDPANCWSSATEIYAGVDGQGRGIRPDHFHLIERCELIARQS